MVQITADFITTSKIEIRMDLEVISNMLQEDNTSKLLLDQGTTDAILLDP